MTTTFNSYSQTQGRFSQRVNNYESSTSQVNSFHNDSGNYWCDTCDKGFRTAHHLENHRKTHQKCNIDGCQFIAHPNVITRHIQMQHSTGLYKKISKSNDPEEIKKWREERKKKYPTKQNIEKKVAQVKAKVARGEKMGIYDSRGSRKPYKSDCSGKNKTKQPFKNSRNFMYEKRIENKHKSNRTIIKPQREWKITLPPTEISGTLKPFGGIQHLILENDDIAETDKSSNDLIEEDEYVPDTSNIFKEQDKDSEINVCGALTSLICNYGSSDDEESSNIIENKTNPIKNKNNKKIEIKTSIEDNSNINASKLYGENTVKEIKENKQPLNSINNSHLVNEVDDDSGPEETKIVKEQIDVQQTNLDEQNNKAFKKLNKPKLSTNFKTKLPYRNNTYRRKLPSTLLEKLLHKEIQKERNIVLQCIRYIVKNNYFDSSSDQK